MFRYLVFNSLCFIVFGPLITNTTLWTSLCPLRVTMHSALLNRLFLDSLAEADLLATVALAYCTCHDLDNFIFGILTPSSLARYLRQHQYALLHDNYHKHFSSFEDTLIRFTIYRLQIRCEANILFTSIAEYLGPVIAHTPLHMFWKSPPMSPNFSISRPLKAKGRSIKFPADSIKSGFETVLSTLWMYSTWFLKGNNIDWLGIINILEPHPILKAYFLFSKQYIDLYETAQRLTSPRIFVSLN